jgi:outer membrane protein assembly factor BamB
MKNMLRQLFLLLLAVPLTAQSPSWPQWRGPNGDGTSTETGWNPRALKGGAKVLWNVDIGAGYSNIAIKDNRLFAMGKDRKTLDFVFTCLDAATGKVIWKNTRLRTFGEVQSTPAVDGDKVYGMGKDGALFCLRVSDGEVVWQKSMEKNFGVGSNQLRYGWTSSPIIEGEALLLCANSAGMALRKDTGELIWVSAASVLQGHQASYTSPVLLGVSGARTAIFFGPQLVSEVDIASGTALWQHPHGSEWEVVADPVVSGNQVFYSTLEECGLLERAEGNATVVWKSGFLKSSIYSSVVVDGFLYGHDWSAQITNWDWASLQRMDWPLRCLDLKTGKAMWSVTTKPIALMAADGKLIMLELNGMLRIAEAIPSGFKELSSADVFAGASKPRTFPTPPVLCGGRIYCRNYAGDLVCIDVSK